MQLQLIAMQHPSSLPHRHIMRQYTGQALPAAQQRVLDELIALFGDDRTIEVCIGCEYVQIGKRFERDKMMRPLMMQRS